MTKVKDLYATIGIIFTIVGSVFLAVAIGFLVYSTSFCDNGIKTEGIISDIYSNQVIVTYTVDNEEIRNNIDYRSSFMRIGDEIELYYNQNDPYSIYTTSSNLFIWIFFPISVLLLVLGFFLIIRYLKKNARYKKLKKDGRMIYA